MLDVMLKIISPSKPKRQNKQEIQDFRKGGEDDLPHVRIFAI